MTLRFACTCLCVVALSGAIRAQSCPGETQDSLSPVIQLGEAVIHPLPVIPQDHKVQPGSKRYSRLERRVLKVWPYAAFAGSAMENLETEMASLSDGKARKALINQREEELKTKFEGELRRLTVREGVILIRLIDREAQRTTYGLLQELKGRLSAFMWQSVARIFGHDLKSEYDPLGEDAPIEHIIHVHGLEGSKRPSSNTADCE